MPNTRQLRSAFCRSTLLLHCGLMGLLLAGCGEKAPHLEATVTSPVGRPCVCAHCNEKIDNVTEEHLVKVGGIEHVVCDKQCRADLKKWIAEQ